jgi:phosphohistidine phosphatase
MTAGDALGDHGDVNPRRLVMMRHAKAEPFASTDSERRLTSRGRKAAAEVGRYLADAGVVPDLALVSSAARTVATWEEVRSASGASPREEISDDVYAAAPETVLEIVRALPHDVRTVILVGHNPTAAFVANVLNDGGGDPEVMRGLLEGFPPAAAAVFELPGEWADLVEGEARLTHFHVGHD